MHIRQLVVCVDDSNSNVLNVEDEFHITDVKPGAVKINGYSSWFREDRFQDFDEYYPEPVEPYSVQPFEGCCGACTIYFDNDEVIEAERLLASFDKDEFRNLSLCILAPFQDTETNRATLTAYGFVKLCESRASNNSYNVHTWARGVIPEAPVVEPEETFH